MLSSTLISTATLLTFAAPCERVSLVATVDDAARTLEGTIACVGDASSEPVSFALYPSVLDRPRGLDDVSRAWVYPKGFDPGRIEIDGQRATEPWVQLRANETHRFATRIPRRTAALGHHEGTTYALAGWHPIFGDQQHKRLFARPIEYSISIPGRWDAWVAGRRSPPGRSRVLSGVHVGRSVPMVLAPQLETIRTPSGPYLIPRPRRFVRRASDPVWELREISSTRDHFQTRKLRETLQLGREKAEEVGLPASEPLTVIRAPLRERFIAPFDGGLAISDRAFLFLDYELFIGFHQLALWRAQLGAYALRATRTIETDWPPEQVADILGATLRDLMETERFGGKESADRLLNRFAVIPEIDSLVFAPQIPLVDALYDAIDESPKARNHPEDFYHPRPRGKIFFEKVLDRIGVEALREAARTYAKRRKPWLVLLQEISGESGISAWLEPFKGAYPEVDYALKSIESDAAQIGVTVSREGAEIEEPITVLLTDAEGHRHRATRLGPGKLVVEAPGPPSQVIVDPDSRLVEKSTRNDKLARFNNRTPVRWRFLLNNITGLVAVTNHQLSIASSFSLRRINDLRYGFGASLGISPTAIGGSIGASYRFGKQLTPLLLSSSLSVGAGFQRLRVEQGVGQPGNQTSLSVSYGFDDRLNGNYSFEGKGFRIRTSGVIAQLDNADSSSAFSNAGASAYWLQPLGFHNGVFLRLRGDAIFGDAPIQNLLRLGGRSVGARGFEPTELRGQERVIGSVEWRHALAVAQRVDLGGLLMWTRLEGAAFADAVLLPNSRADCGTDMFYDVGYGLRFIGDILNITPAAFTIDFGVPLNRCGLESERTPISVYVGFLQSFLPF